MHNAFRGFLSTTYEAKICIFWTQNFIGSNESLINNGAISPHNILGGIQMKKLLTLLCILFLLVSFTACGEKETKKSVIKVGATPVPHSELLNLIQDDLEKEQITLEIVEFTDYVTPNLALSDGEIDANFFQHQPYLDDFSKEHNLDLVSIAGIHVEPLGLYSTKYDSFDSIPDGSTIAIPNDGVNGGRALLLLDAKGVIRLKDNQNLLATKEEIVENPHGIIIQELEAAQLPRVLEDVEAAIINGNYALEAGFRPAEDALLLEGSESPYVNILVVKKDREKDALLQKLAEALQSEEVKTYIQEHYDGGVVPVF